MAQTGAILSSKQLLRHPAVSMRQQLHACPQEDGCLGRRKCAGLQGKAAERESAVPARWAGPWRWGPLGSLLRAPPWSAAAPLCARPGTLGMPRGPAAAAAQRSGTAAALIIVSHAAVFKSIITEDTCGQPTVAPLRPFAELCSACMQASGGACAPGHTRWLMQGYGRPRQCLQELETRGECAERGGWPPRGAPHRSGAA